MPVSCPKAANVGSFNRKGLRTAHKCLTLVHASPGQTGTCGRFEEHRTDQKVGEEFRFYK